jgi:hypothetical protein
MEVLMDWLILGAITYAIVKGVIHYLGKPPPPPPDREVKHEVKFFGRRVTTVTDRRSGLFEKWIRDSSGYRVFREKKCFTCGCYVSRSGDGTFRCCGRSWK